MKSLSKYHEIMIMKQEIYYIFHIIKIIENLVV